MIPSSVLGITGGPPRYGGEPPLAPEGIWAPLPVLRMPLAGLDLEVGFVDSGGQGPPLVLIHGLSSYISYWEPQIAHYTALGWRVLALDLPGFGSSDRPDAPYTPRWYADVVARWMDAVGAPRAVVMGHSMGGQIALTLALQAPERVGALVLAAPAGLETFSPEAAAWMRSYWTPDRAATANEAEVRANFTQLAFNRVDAGVERLLCERVRLQKHPSFKATSRAVSRAIAGMLDQPVYARLGEIRAPTLVIFGDQDRMIPNPVFNPGPTAGVAERGRAIPGARIVLLPRAGHMVQHDDPDGTHRATDPFLARSRRA